MLWCWDADCEERPNFTQIAAELEKLLQHFNVSPILSSQTGRWGFLTSSMYGFFWSRCKPQIYFSLNQACALQERHLWNFLLSHYIMFVSFIDANVHVFSVSTRCVISLHCPLASGTFSLSSLLSLSLCRPPPLILSLCFPLFFKIIRLFFSSLPPNNP